MSDPYYQQNNPYQYPPQYDQPSQPSGQYGQVSGAYPPAQQYPQYPQQPAPYPSPSMPLQQAYQQPVYVQTPVIVTQAPSTSGWAIASLVCSLVGISLLGVIFGHVGLSEINRSNGMVGGKGLAIAGLIIGYIPLAFELFFGCLFVLGLLGALGAAGATSGLAPIFR